ncbi:MAG: hypothetical protein PVI44_09040 [Balneolaceae bacterium]|jgi:Tol biopolymer transport system component
MQTISEIFLVDANGGSPLVKLTDNTASEGNPSWSPDGSQIAFERDIGSGVYNIFLMNADGSGSPQNLTNDIYSNRNPVWSEDGTQIIYERIQGSNIDVYSINTDGTNSTPLTTDSGRDENPLWGGLR